jgi:hypothetical protein
MWGYEKLLIISIVIVCRKPIYWKTWAEWFHKSNSKKKYHPASTD